jgi:HAD superfamily hydrolase (TIGR01490 family)
MSFQKVEAMTDPRPIVAAFDFDGTLTYRDSLLPFAIFVRGKLRSTAYLTLELPRLAGFVLKFVPRQIAKEALLKRFFGGEHIETLRKWGQEFAHKGLPFLLRPEAMEKFHWHKQQGHRCVLVSASVDVYLNPWAYHVGFDDVVSSRLAVGPDHLVSGRLEGANCWGPEKTRRLEELLGPKAHYILYAYGDSRGDQEMLSMADHAYKGVF